jgi:hypothetical protein
MADGGQGARPLIFGSLAAGGTLGILIPPSIPMTISVSIRSRLPALVARRRIVSVVYLHRRGHRVGLALYDRGALVAANSGQDCGTLAQWALQRAFSAFSAWRPILPLPRRQGCFASVQHIQHRLPHWAC